MKPIYKLNSMNKKFKRLNNIKKFNRERNERSMNLQLKTKTQLYNTITTYSLLEYSKKCFTQTFGYCCYIPTSDNHVMT